MKNLLNLDYKDVKPIVTKLEEGEIINPKEPWNANVDFRSCDQIINDLLVFILVAYSSIIKKVVVRI